MSVFLSALRADPPRIRAAVQGAVQEAAAVLTGPLIAFFVPGRPGSTQTGTVIFRHGRAFPVRRGKQGTGNGRVGWVDWCGLAAMQHRPLVPWTELLTVRLIFRMPVPQKVSREIKARLSCGENLFTTAGADPGNLVKGLLDAWQGILYVDDKQIVHEETKKYLALPDQGPGVEVRITPVPAQRCAITKA